MTDLIPRDAVPAPVPIPANVIYAYPLTAPPPASITDATVMVQRVLGIIARLGDELREATTQPYPCAVCQRDLSQLPQWEWPRHFARHSMAQRARVVGWFRAVMGT